MDAKTTVKMDAMLSVAIDGLMVDVVKQIDKDGR